MPSAMATSPTSFFFAILLVFVSLCSSHGNKVYGDDDRLQGFGLAKAEDFMHGSICSESKVPGPYSLKVVHRYGPCSPTRDDPPPSTVHESNAGRVAHLHDLLRRIRAILRGNSSADAPQASLKAATVGVRRSVFGPSYVATVGFGTPAREQTLVLDTGSNLCWVQCKPCKTWYRQQQPIFDPHNSGSYHNVTCDAQACLRLDHRERAGCVENTCVYRVDYADHTSTTGFLATERLTLAGSVLENFVFGCGHTNQGDFHRAAGMLGLGRGYHSFARQAAHLLRLGDDDINVFSYCLPSVKDRTGHLTFGRTAVGSRPAYTPMVYPLGVHDGRYFVDFVGISVAGTRLSIGPEHLATHGTIVDSGTSVSVLPPVAYAALRGAFRKRMSKKYELAPPRGTLDTCYIITRPPFKYPAVALHFRGVDLFLKPEQVFYVEDGLIYCLAFVSSELTLTTIIGSAQQRGMEVIFDNQNHRIGFSTGSVHC